MADDEYPKKLSWGDISELAILIGLLYGAYIWSKVLCLCLTCMYIWVLKPWNYRVFRPITKIIITYPLIFIVSVSLSIISIYFYVSNPGSVVVEEHAYAWTPQSSVVVDKSGHISGLGNQIRAFLQGRRFWQNQLSSLDREVECLEARPAELDEFQHEWDKLQRTLKDSPESKELDKFEKLCIEHPVFCEAQALRDRADAIEDAERMRIQKKEWRDRIDELKVIRIVLKAKVSPELGSTEANLYGVPVDVGRLLIQWVLVVLPVAVVLLFLRLRYLRKSEVPVSPTQAVIDRVKANTPEVVAQARRANALRYFDEKFYRKQTTADKDIKMAKDNYDLNMEAYQDGKVWRLRKKGAVPD